MKGQRRPPSSKQTMNAKTHEGSRSRPKDAPRDASRGTAGPAQSARSTQRAPAPRPAEKPRRASSSDNADRSSHQPSDRRDTRPITPPRDRGQRQKSSQLSSDRCVVGRHAVTAVLIHQTARAERLFVDDEARAADVIAIARAHKVPVVVRERHELDGLVDGDLVHQGLVLACGPFPWADLDTVCAPDTALGLVLDGVVDPRNLGAATRAAYALGATFVALPDRHSASPTASAYKASVGALARIPVVEIDNLRRRLDQLKERGFWIIGAEASGDSAPWSVDMTGKAILVIGGEDRGLRRLTREACDHVVAIPMQAADMSLNAADAATVLLYEALRQRKMPFPTR
jgi:23S rRNA (guanosine2251-2'-O)-methyltransferase